MEEHEDGGTRFLSLTFRETRYGLGCPLRMLLAVLDHGSGREAQPKSFQDWHRRITAQLCCASVAPFVSCMLEGTKTVLKTRDSAPSDTSGRLVKTAVAAHVILRFIFPAGLKDRVSALHFPLERAFCTCDRPVAPFVRGSQWGDRGSRRPCTTRPCMSDWLVLIAVAAHQTLRSCFLQNSARALHPAGRPSLNFEHLLT
jgi:hypothetical protein